MYTLRRYQSKAVEATLAHFRRSRRPAVIVLPTGAGKSIVIAELARLARGRVLVLAHVRELVEQNYSKFCRYSGQAGIYSAGLQRKDASEKVIFGSIQSVARAEEDFFADFSLLVIDECHRVSAQGDTQYSQVIQKILSSNRGLAVLGLTATPYRLDTGWIYQFSHLGALRTQEPRIFRKCIYEVSLREMIQDGYLTPPVQIDAPVASYDFSSLMLRAGERCFQLSEIEAILKDQARVTPVIVRNIVELAETRQGALIFTSSIRHAREILALLPAGESALVIGETEDAERDRVVLQFKERKIKFLVNVSVLTTGFDAPHVDLIAILRPTESIGLYQQIVGRGLRLSDGKSDCLVLDYTGVPHDIFSPQIRDRRPSESAVPVAVPCPNCEHVNDFWGIKDETGEVVEHFGKKCNGAIESPDSDAIVPCGFRYRFSVCPICQAENDLGAERCHQCDEPFVDSVTLIRDARSAPNTHVMRPDSMVFERKVDKKGRERLEVRYYDLDAEYVSEVFFFSSESDVKVFHYNFIRLHNRLPERPLRVRSIADAIAQKERFRIPIFVIARKQDRYWRIREKVFL